MSARCDNCLNQSLNMVGIALHRAVGNVPKLLKAGVAGALIGSKIATGVGMQTGFVIGVATAALQTLATENLRARVDTKKEVIQKEGAPYLKLALYVAEATLPVLAITMAVDDPGQALDTTANAVSSLVKTYLPDVSTFMAAYLIAAKPVQVTLLNGTIVSLGASQGPMMVAGAYNKVRDSIAKFKAGFAENEGKPLPKIPTQQGEPESVTASLPTQKSVFQRFGKGLRKMFEA